MLRSTAVAPWRWVAPGPVPYHYHLCDCPPLLASFSSVPGPLRNSSDMVHGRPAQLQRSLLALATGACRWSYRPGA